MPQHAPSEVHADRRRVQVEEVVEVVDCGVRGFAFNQWYCGVLKALGDLIDRVGRHGRGGNN